MVSSAFTFGMFINVLQIGEGSTTYLGEFLGGKREGKGTLKFADGKYKGSWLADLKHGTGVLNERVRSLEF